MTLNELKNNPFVKECLEINPRHKIIVVRYNECDDLSKKPQSLKVKSKRPYLKHCDDGKCQCCECDDEHPQVTTTYEDTNYDEYIDNLNDWD